MTEAVLTIEAIVAVDPPREHRLHPRQPRAVCTAAAGGPRQAFVIDLRSGVMRQATASEVDVSEPEWSPDGRRLAFCASDAVWVLELETGRLTRLDGDSSGTTHPRWS